MTLRNETCGCQDPNGCEECSCRYCGRLVMLNKLISFMRNNLELCFALDLLIITGTCYLLKINYIITFVLIALYVYFILSKFSHLIFKRKQI